MVVIGGGGECQCQCLLGCYDVVAAVVFDVSDAGDYWPPASLCCCAIMLLHQPDAQYSHCFGRHCVGG